MKITSFNVYAIEQIVRFFLIFSTLQPHYNDNNEKCSIHNFKKHTVLISNVHNILLLNQ